MNPDNCIPSSKIKKKSPKRKSTGKKRKKSSRRVQWTRSGLTYSLPRDQLRGYKLNHLLGEGMSGSVYLDGNHAIKIYPLERMIPCWSCKLDSGTKRRAAAKHTRCSDAPDFGGDCRCEGKPDFQHEVKATKRMSGSGIAPKFVDAWIAKGGESSIGQQTFEVGILVTEAWPMSFAQYRKKYSRKLRGQNKKRVEAHFNRIAAKLDKMKLFAHDLQFENLVVKVADDADHSIVDMALIDFSDMGPPARGDCNYSEFKEIMSICAY